MFGPSHPIWIALSLVFLFLGLSLGNVVLLTGAVFVLLSALLTTTLSSPSGIAIERDIPRTSCWVGDTLVVNRHVTVGGGIGSVFVHDILPPEAQVVAGSNLRVVWRWWGRKTADLSYQLQFPKRGTFILEGTGWESQAPFGINRGASGSGGPSFEISVVPRIRSVTRLNEVRAARKNIRYQDFLSKTGTTTGEFKEVRPYQPGDPIKWINWKASARASRSDNLPLVNEPEQETRKAVWIFLDMADYMDVGSPLSNPLENTVEASGTLAQYYLSRGSTLGAYAYNSYGGVGELLPPESRMSQFNRLVKMLVELKPGPPEQDLLQSVERCKSFLFRLRPDVFIITRLDALYSMPGEAGGSFERFNTAVRRLISLRSQSRQFGSVRVVHVDPQETPSESQGLGLAKWEAQVVARNLRESGADVIEWEPAREEFMSVLVRHIGVFR